VTLYSASKPRDRSHFEKFRSYHERLYAQVEPTSVTPFSPPALQRALHAVITAYARQSGPGAVARSPYPYPEDLIATCRELMVERVGRVDKDEAATLTRLFDLRADEWRDWQRMFWDGSGAQGDVPLLREPGRYSDAGAKNVSWPTPQSMRNVDAECQAEITLLYADDKGASHAKGPIRRAQLVAPLGVGGITVARDGTSLIAAGLDHWFKRESGTGDNIDLDDYQIEEWRLQGQLQVEHFRLAPDYRKGGQWGGGQIPNTELTIPFLRFPQWHVCPKCKRLERAPLTLRARFFCPDCEKKTARKERMHQVRFIAMCDHGHIQDFPWREWVHRTSSPGCNEPLRLIATGSASLGGEMVRCGCGKERSLSGIMQANVDGTTFLSNNLSEDGTIYRCRGRLPWFGIEEDAQNLCSQPLRGTLPSASNVYFAHTRSSIYLPRGTAAVPEGLITLLEKPPYSTTISSARDLGALANLTPAILRNKQSLPLKPFSDAQVAAAIGMVTADPPLPETEEGEGAAEEYSEVAFRREECTALRSGRQESELQVKVVNLSDYAPEVSRFFSRIALVERLKETRALFGFSRIYPEVNWSPEEHRAMLWRQPPPMGVLALYPSGWFRMDKEPGQRGALRCRCGAGRHRHPPRCNRPLAHAGAPPRDVPNRASVAGAIGMVR